MDNAYLANNIPVTGIKILYILQMNYRDDVEILLYAVEEGDIDIVQFLLENGIDLNLQNAVFRNTALIYASIRGFTNIVKLLSEYT